MSSEADRQKVAKGVGLAALVAVVIALNVAIPVSDIDLPSIGTPDIPGWVKTVLHVKNWVLFGIFLVFVVLTALHRDNA